MADGRHIQARIEFKVNKQGKGGSEHPNNIRKEIQNITPRGKETNHQ